MKNYDPTRNSKKEDSFNESKSNKTEYPIKESFIFDDDIFSLLDIYDSLELGTLLEQAWCYYFKMAGIDYQFKPKPITVVFQHEVEFPPTFFFNKTNTYGIITPTQLNSAQNDIVEKVVSESGSQIVSLVGLPKPNIYSLYAKKDGQVKKIDCLVVYNKKQSSFILNTSLSIPKKNIMAFEMAHDVVSYKCDQIILVKDE